MKLNYAGLYPKNGSAVFRYAVTGTPTEIADYVSKQEQTVFQENTNHPLFFSHKPLGAECELVLSRDGNKFYPKDDDMLMAQSMAKSLGSSGDRYLADFASQRIAEMQRYLAKNKNTVTKTAEPEPEDHQDEEPVDKL